VSEQTPQIDFENLPTPGGGPTPDKPDTGLLERRLARKRPEDLPG
jgi:hypothetical protein